MRTFIQAQCPSSHTNSNKMKTIEEQVAELIGRKVYVKPGHPYSGEVGEIIDIEASVGVTGRPGIKIKGGNHGDYYVFDSTLLQLLD